MELNLVAAHLLRVEDSLTLDHSPPTTPITPTPPMPSMTQPMPMPYDRRSGPAEDAMPAMLVIPSGRGLAEPHLIVMTDPDRQRLARPHGWITTDIHLVGCGRGRRGRSRHGRPGVLVNRRRPGVIERVARRRDGDIVVAHRPGGCELRLRDGRLLTVEGPRIAPATAGVASSYAMYGSAVHCWQAAGISVSTLEQAVVAVGRYVTTTAERSMRFLVTGRVELELHRPRPMTAWHAA